MTFNRFFRPVRHKAYWKKEEYTDKTYPYCYLYDKEKSKWILKFYNNKNGWKVLEKSEPPTNLDQNKFIEINIDIAETKLAVYDLCQ